MIDKESNKPIVPQSPVVLIQPGKAQQAFGLSPPYILGGSFFGGAVAIEMARQLAQSGQSIPLVAFIDTSAYTNLPKLMIFYPTKNSIGNN
ncbi:MAG TPA: hypothetical protein DCG13_05260 [Legionellales bacterium]|nr:hypothetical protein [Legionellales bacterium]HCA90096.1 hypothetical protein [Legionellales bacterium]